MTPSRWREIGEFSLCLSPNRARGFDDAREFLPLQRIDLVAAARRAGRKAAMRTDRKPVERREFRGFGMHDETRRRVIVSRVAAGMARRHNIDFMRIPFLLFADETVEDTDEVLAPILDTIMREAAEGYGMKRR